ncbi:ABC transporter permease [Microbacterium sp. F51-2R]|jgi:peptide/nickel transport system permease protein|uniref:ABC transporter permease n=1 Tax=Microbacterium sp. F51-2R TaxID=3445777 RepID=UPI003FA0C732
MFRFILRRVLAGVVLLFVVTSIAYVLLYLGAGDIARQLLGQDATQEQVAQMNAQLGLDQPVLVSYWNWLTNALTGDFGTSWFTQQPVVAAISSRVAVTLSLVIGTVLVTAVVGTALGVWAARKRGAADRTVQVVSVLGFAIPGFLIAIFLVSIFAIQLGWFKPTGFVPLTTSFVGWLSTVTLPIIALSVGAIAAIAAQIRGGVIDTMRLDWVRTLRSRGLSENRVLYKHVLRNAAGPALAVLGVQFIGLIGGAIIVEQIFAIPGLGQIATSSTAQGDIPLVMGLVVVTALITVIVGIIIEILHGFLNPKARVS